MSFPINHDIISTVEKQPAKVLDLMVINSFLTKIQFKQFPKMQNEIADLTRIITSISTESSKPDLIHSDLRHQELTLFYVQKVIDKLIVCRDQIDFSIFTSVYSNLIKLKDNFQASTTTIHNTNFNVDTTNLLEEYGVSNMLGNGLEQARLDFKNFKYRDYSNFESKLNKNKVNKEFSEKLFKFVAKELMGYEFKNNINFTEQENPSDLYWGIDKSGISYVSPLMLEFATYLSFEIPHNISHLIHLDKLNEQKPTTYIDSMKQRAFFEGVAIYAERLFSGVINIDKLYDFLGDELKINPKDIKEWFEYIRTKENALRSVRLVSDVETMSGLGYSQVIRKMRDEIPNISEDKLHSETSIYYQFTGLSSCYTPGGVKLIEDHAKNPLIFFNNLNPKSNSWEVYNINQQND